jgi:hypothetical protein
LEYDATLSRRRKYIDLPINDDSSISRRRIDDDAVERVCDDTMDI